MFPQSSVSSSIRNLDEKNKKLSVQQPWFVTYLRSKMGMARPTQDNL